MQIAVFHADAIKDVGEPHAGPFRVADRALPPARAGDGFDRVQLLAAVAGAKQRCRERARREILPQIGERQVKRTGNPAADPQPVSCGVEPRNIAVCTDEEEVLRRDETSGEHRQRRLRIERPLAPDDQI